jgi:hypothetical protein
MYNPERQPRMYNPERQPRMYNLETLATLGTQDTGQINVRENQSGNQECTSQRDWQHEAHKWQSRMYNPERLAT